MLDAHGVPHKTGTRGLVHFRTLRFLPRKSLPAIAQTTPARRAAAQRYPKNAAHHWMRNPSMHAHRRATRWRCRRSREHGPQLLAAGRDAA